MVVRYANGVDPADEQVFPVTILSDQPTVGVAAILPSRVRKGGFMFDLENALWYRIRNVEERPGSSWGGRYPDSFAYIVQLEDDAIGVSSTAIFPSDIIDVFPLGARQMPEELRP